MGSYSHLTVGDIEFSWKYFVPTFVTFMFEADDFFVRDVPGEDWQEMGYRTTVQAAKAVLDRHGYTVAFLSEIYVSFAEDLQATARDQLGETVARLGDYRLTNEEIERSVRAHLTAAESDPKDDLVAFSRFLRQAVELDFKMSPFLDERVLPFSLPGHAQLLRTPVREDDRFRRSDLYDFDALQDAVFERALDVPLSVLRVVSLLDYESFIFYPEVVSLLYTRLVLDAMPDETVVELEASELIESEAELQSLPTELAHELVRKVDVYQRMFRVLSAQEEDVQDRYARVQVRNALRDLSRASSAQEKGEALEELMAGVFSISPQLQVVHRTYSTGDEEIDLIVKNNVNRPFWLGLGSSLFFVECKNWTSPVGAPEIRNFEVKLQNHSPMTRVGLLVAPGGFTKEATTALKRSSREPYSVALVLRSDLEALASGGKSVLDWLETLLSRPV